ncbi:hypothetical protein E2C01_079257 [Portunus trituberculatus]|uniref:Uncharacterized protein n=1 Tax=Portunus trituberculatus TaxID=210409 RepID=A0A5B7IV38_PORTR|nr:hypothetical protein [Portunus trituberculatus]
MFLRESKLSGERLHLPSLPRSGILQPGFYDEPLRCFSFKSTRRYPRERQRGGRRSTMTP